MEEDTLYQKVTLPYTDAAPKAGETPFFLVLLLLIFLPPAAWYVMAKERSYHRWFAFLIAFYSLLAIFGSLIIRQIFQPQVTRLYQSLHINEPSVTPFAYLNIYIFLGIIELVAAVVIFLVIRKYKDLPKTWLIISIAILACNSVFQPLSLLYFTYVSLHSVYQQTKSLSVSAIPSLTPIPTAIIPIPSDEVVGNIKIHHDNLYHFTFDYPSNWFIDGNDNSISLNDTKKIDSENYKIAINIREYPIDQAKYFLNYGDAGASIKALNQTTEIINGKEITKATVRYSTPTSMDPSTVQYVTKDKYRILVPLDKKTIIIESTTDTENVANAIVQSLQFGGGISPTCRPRPSCLDATPKCLIAETADMCPAPTK